jgi:YD repeat-containing protein
MTRFREFFVFLTILNLAQIGAAQVATGTPPFGSFGGGPFDVVNLGNLNVHFVIPIIHKAGRGMSFYYDMSYDSSVWYPVGSSGNQAWQPVSNFGWAAQTEAETGSITYRTLQAKCPSLGLITTLYTFSQYRDSLGAIHPAIVHISDGNCGGLTSASTTATDGSGYTLFASDDTGTPTAKVTNRAGGVTVPPLNGGTGAGTLTDANGNQISVNTSEVFTDTLGQNVLSVTGSAPNPVKFNYIPPAGEATSSTVPATMSYKAYTVATNFGASGITEYPATSMSLVDRITFNDGSFYSFTYEATPSTPTSGACTPLAGTYSVNCVTARIASVTLPTGGSISYTYSGGSNGAFSDGSTAGLTRKVTPDGSTISTWTYSRSGSGASWTTTVNDALNNQTIINFAEDTATTNPSSNFYETQRKVYQGTSSLLLTVLTCYKANFASCSTASVASPITQKDVYRTVPGQSLPSLSEIKYDGFGQLQEDKEFDYGVTLGAAPTVNPVTDTVITYASLANGIVDRPATVVTNDGSNHLQASTTYHYDETAVTGTTGTPQHVAVTGSRGNMTSIAAQANFTVTLYRKFTYYDTGTLNTSTGLSTSSTANGPTTTYSYASGTASCGNSFVTSINEPLSLSRSMTWDCVGGVLTSVTDENGQISSVQYTGTGADPSFWRPFSTTDQAGNVTSLTYTGATRFESKLLFNSNNSVVDQFTTVDGLGRLITGQAKRGPSSSTYDSVETDYNLNGNISKLTRPYAGALGALCSGTCPGTLLTYDSLNRALTNTDGGNGSISLDYTNYPDTFQTIGPAPTGENTKRKQFEYDGLGRLGSVCEVTGLSGSGACAQLAPQTGYWTKYTYSPLGKLTGVTQNAQAGSGTQTRAYTYDMLGRVASENNPETGNSTYSYDSLSSDASCGTVTSAGDLLKRVDAVGNVTCYKYDVLHRVTSIIVPTGSNSSNTPKKFFVYDGATVTGTSMANAKTRLAEAYTCTGACTSKITDLGFGYSARGESTDVYQSTPNSGGYYHVTTAFWANGALKQLSGVGLPTLTYGADGEGRSSTVSASTGANPVTATSYNAASQATGVTFGSGDPAGFSYDANTGRMTQYKLTINGSATFGNLTWNANGTLKTLAITDPFNAADVQTCNYTHDDLARIASVDCGATKWQQNFSFDPFGNLTKTVPTGGTGTAFQPTYDTATNRYSGGLPGLSYDANGNLLNDSFHAYTWDAAGRPTSVDTIGLTYDAFGREVEENNGSVFTEYVYALGQKSY